MTKTCASCGNPFDEPESEPFRNCPGCRIYDIRDRSPQRYERTDQPIHLSPRDIERLKRKGKK